MARRRRSTGRRSRPRPCRGASGPLHARTSSRTGGRTSPNAAAPGGVHLRRHRVGECRSLGGDTCTPRTVPSPLAGVEHSSVRQASERSAPVVVLPVDSYGQDTARTPSRRQSGAAEEIGNPACARALPGGQPRSGNAPTRGRKSWRSAAATVSSCTWTRPRPCGHMDLDLDELGADMVSVSAHKLGGPPGIGALVVRRGMRFAPFVVGGDQERARARGPREPPGRDRVRRCRSSPLRPGRLASESEQSSRPHGSHDRRPRRRSRG